MLENRLLLRTALLCSTAVFTISPAWAQDQAAVPAGDQVAEPSAERERVGGLEDIVVTARRREENLQNIPVAAAVITERQIEGFGINSVEKVAALAPQLIISRNGSGNGASIGLRGVSVNATSISLEQSVAIVIDGVYYSGGRALNLGMFDLSQVEVLKGPQSLFYGKNTTAGAISFTTADPTSDLRAMLRMGYEFRGHNPYAEAYVSGPLTSNLSARIAARVSYQRDPLIKNLSVGQTTYTRDFVTGLITPHTYAGADNEGERQQTVRAALKYELGGLIATLKATYNKYDSATPNSAAVIAVCEATGRIQTDATAPCGPSFTHVQGSVPADIAATLPYAGRKGGRPYLDFEAFNTTLNLQYETDAITFNVVPAYTVWTNYWNGDFDFTDRHTTPVGAGVTAGSGGNNGNTREQQRTFSVEARAQTSFEGMLNFMVGGYFQDNELSFSQENIFPGGVDNSAAPSRFRYLTVYKDGLTLGKTYAAFGQAQLDVTSQINITGGVRYTHEVKDNTLDQPYVYPGALGTFAVRKIGANQEFNNWSPEATISYKPVSNVTLYASYRTGYKSGGFSISGTIAPLTQPEDADFDPEIVKGFEGGIKSTLFDNQLRLNLDAFSYTYSGLQIDYFDPLTIRYLTLNAGKARTRGAEVDMTFSPYSAPGLTVRAAVAYTDAKYTSFPSAPCLSGQRPDEGCNLGLNAVSGAFTAQSLTGQDTPQAPKWTATAGIEYETPVSTGVKLGVSLNGRYSSRYKIYAFAYDAADRFYQGSYGMIDATIRLAEADDAWELSLMGKNLTNEFVKSSGFDLTYTGARAGLATGVHADTRVSVYDPRTVALQATFRF